MSRRRLRALAGLLVVPPAIGAFAGVASAHGVAGSRFDAPIPLPLLFLGAGGTVGVTVLFLFAGEVVAESSWRSPRVLTIPDPLGRALRYAMTGLFLAGVLAAQFVGVTGPQVAAENFATVFTWPVWFRGLALLAVVVGTAWPAISPWRTIHRGLSLLEGRPIALLGGYPARLGVAPALVGFVAVIGVVETLTVVPRSPRLTTVVISAYALAMVVGAVLFGQIWLRKADPLAVFYSLFGRVAPIEVTREDGGYAIRARPPWRGCERPVAGLATVAFAIAMVYTVSFDGFANTDAYLDVLFSLRDLLGTGPTTSILVYLLGLAGFVVAFSLSVRVVEHLGGGDRAEDGADWRGSMVAFAPTVLPIAAAYEVAHNYPYVLRSLGTLLGMVVPGLGPVNPLASLPMSTFWGTQVALIVLGHVFAVVAAHHVALDRYGTLADARRGHLPLLAIMIGYTVLSLWISSQPVVT
jgi:hypothetical protein